ncbi:glycosyltransferase [Lentiprolixibacter aurantiacus]|uniref:Glycosyltransferase n=1 Tax=Lentiprolixibacter aurantiacus TaxID=2993939 RepID=A0AAE3MMB0_9FLAO|nr:glycosyltransferase [Lentiprolixibacter aurantiacus]MCX2719991.1 glycosyltransferase [Lentiprolixibacter aurantiacus]
MKKIIVKPGAKLDDYKAYGTLYNLVNQFLEDVAEFPDKLRGKTIWMINSTAIGGGVAEMLPSQMRIIRTLGINIEWLVIEARDEAFFNLTKRIHNAIHGSGKPNFTEDDREVYERVNARNLEKALEYIEDGDLVVIHDPQPMPLGGMIRKHKKVKLVWRCHIGLETENEVTRAVWDFLSPYFADYDRFVYSLASYVPEILKDKTAIIPPAIDPLSHKNRMLWMSKCLGILQQSGIIREQLPVLYPNYKHKVRRVMPDGSFDTVNHDSELDIIFHPTVLQISRWDRLKGFKELMEAFILMKRDNEKKTDKSSLVYRRIRHCRLTLGGPDPAFVSDDPEGMEVLNELIEQYKALSVDLQRAIALLLLPLDNPKENALIVNALQRSATIVVQNSIQEGFGLTATEAMWKQRPVLVSGAAGLRAQVQHDINGRINPDPTNIAQLAKCLEEMLSNPKERDKWGFNGQVRVINNFTLFSQIKAWLSHLSSLE